MQQSFQVDAVLNVKGNADKKFQEFINIVKKAHESLKLFNNTFKNLDLRFQRLGEVLNITNPKVSSLGVRLNSLGRNASKSTMEMGALNRELRSTASSLDRLERSSNANKSGGIGKGKLLFGLGGIGTAAAAGYGAYEGVKHVYNAGAEFQQAQQQLMSQGGVSQADLNKLSRIAQTTHIAGVSSIKLMEAFTDAFMATKSLPEAQKIGTQIASVTFGNQMFGTNFNRHDMRQMLQSAEFLSGGDPHKFESIFNTIEQLYSAEGGRMKPREILNMFKTGGTAVYGLTNQSLFGLLTAMQEVSGMRSGTSLQTGRRQLLAGSLNPTQAHDLLQFGFLDRSKVKFNSLGYIQKVLPGAFKPQYERQLDSDPFGFLKTYVGQLKKFGITKDEDVYKYITRDFSRTFAALLSNMFKNMGKIERSIPLNEQATNASQIGGVYASQMGGAPKVLAASWESFNVALAKDIGPGSQQLLLGLSKFLDMMTDFLNGPVVKLLNWADSHKNSLVSGIGNIVNTIMPGGRQIVDIFDRKKPNQQISGTVQLTDKGGRKLADVFMAAFLKQTNAPTASTSYRNPQDGFTPAQLGSNSGSGF